MPRARSTGPPGHREPAADGVEQRAHAVRLHRRHARLHAARSRRARRARRQAGRCLRARRAGLSRARRSPAVPGQLRRAGARERAHARAAWPLSEVAPNAPPEPRHDRRARDAARSGSPVSSAREPRRRSRRFSVGAKLVGSHHYTTWQLLQRWVRRHRAFVVAALALLVGGGIIAAVAVRQVLASRARHRTPREPRRARGAGPARAFRRRASAARRDVPRRGVSRRPARRVRTHDARRGDARRRRQRARQRVRRAGPRGRVGARRARGSSRSPMSATST